MSKKRMQGKTKQKDKDQSWETKVIFKSTFLREVKKDTYKNTTKTERTT